MSRLAAIFVVLSVGTVVAVSSSSTPNCFSNATMTRFANNLRANGGQLQRRQSNGCAQSQCEACDDFGCYQCQPGYWIATNDYQTYFCYPCTSAGPGCTAARDFPCDGTQYDNSLCGACSSPAYVLNDNGYCQCAFEYTADSNGYCNSDFSSCLGNRETGTDYWTPVLRRTSTANESACCAACSSYPGCNAYSWTSTDNTCYLRPYHGNSHGTAEINSGYRNSTSVQPASTGFSCSAATREPGFDYWGPNLSQTLTGSEADCCSACGAYIGCGAYSWTSDDNVCYLKPYASNRHASTNIFSGYTINNTTSP